MIDNPVTAAELFEQLERALPLPARLTPELRVKLSQQNPAAAIRPDCSVTGLHYLGDEGGIVCRLDLGASVQNQAFVSITHLRFHSRLPLSRKITAYQKHRVKRLQRQTP